jgi:RHS repeat-associated protein
VKTLNTEREDGATRTLSFEYDLFGLAPVQSKVDTTNTPSLLLRVTRDALTLDPLSTTDPNEVQIGIDFDGFGHLVRSTVTPAGGPLGVLLTVNYLGFSGIDPLGRRINTKSFSEPVPPGNTGGALGRTSITYFDELGRGRRTEVALGADYANQTLIERMRNYDVLGRVAFEADPFPSTQDPGTAYGTTYLFNTDGFPSCFIRGKGPQALSGATTDELAERYPTCYSRSFVSHEEVVSVSNPDSLLSSSPQVGVARLATRSGIGWVTSRATWQSGSRLEYATFNYDHLGQLTGMTRYQEPAIIPSNPVQASRRLDSLGQVLQWQEPDSMPQYAEYSDWGELLEVRWKDTTTLPSTERRLVNQYDALGRMTHREERNNGVVDHSTLNAFFYDAGVNVAPEVTPTYTLGRLVHAQAPTGDIFYSYDSLGQVNARTFRDGGGLRYVEKTTRRADGAPLTLEFYLPDTGFTKELVEYGYDSADRLRGMKFFDGSILNILYQASDIDPFGRVRTATFGGTAHYAANYAEFGRRLMKEMDVHSALGARRIFDLRYDPVGRELSRAEGNGEGVITGTNITYDSLGRLRDVAKVQGGTSQLEWTYVYDPLGNVQVLRHVPDSSPSAFLSYHQVGDRDRVCRIDYGPIGGPACNVVYDGVGNTIEQPTRTGVRRLSYFASGKVRGITEGAAQANFRYDAFGNVQELDVTGSGISDARHDRRYGGLIERHDEVIDGTATAFVSRNIPGPGVMISKRGTGNEWIFGFGELRGNRFFVDGTGAFVQSADYQPYGEAESKGAQPGSAKYTSLQWNGRDALGAFNLSHLGARLYDPVIGRFLSRDPLVVPRTAATTNAYAFVTNDPVNFSDPSGLQENFCFGFLCPSSGAPPMEIPPLLWCPQCFSPAPAGANPHAANRIPAPTFWFNPPKEPRSVGPRPETAENPNLETVTNAADVSADVSGNIEGWTEEIYVERAEYHTKIPGYAKWATRLLGGVETFIKVAEAIENPTGENIGKAIVSFTKWAAMEWGGPIGAGYAGGATFGELTWDLTQDFKENKLPPLEGKIRHLEREVNGLCNTPVGCVVVESNVDDYYMTRPWSRWYSGPREIPMGPLSNPHGDMCVAIYLCEPTPISPYDSSQRRTMLQAHPSDVLLLPWGPWFR